MVPHERTVLLCLRVEVHHLCPGSSLSPSPYIMSQVWSRVVVCLPGFTLSSVALLLQGNVAQERERA